MQSSPRTPFETLDVQRGNVPMQRLPEDALVEIDRALLDENIVFAIDRYRRATGVDLREAKRAVDDRARQIGVVWKKRWWNWAFIITLALTVAINLINHWIARH
jgi:hypothetical protein